MKENQSAGSIKDKVCYAKRFHYVLESTDARLVKTDTRCKVPYDEGAGVTGQVFTWVGMTIGWIW